MKVVFGYCILVLIMLPTKVTSQNDNRTYKCTVYNEKSKTPLVGSSLKEIRSASIKITDNKGVCFFQKSERFTIEVSFIGYITQSRTIDPADYKNNSNDTINLNFYLKNSIQTIKQVEVYENKKEGLLPANQWLYDYELFDNKLWILIYGNKKTGLQ